MSWGNELIKERYKIPILVLLVEEEEGTKFPEVKTILLVGVIREWTSLSLFSLSFCNLNKAISDGFLDLLNPDIWGVENGMVAASEATVWWEAWIRKLGSEEELERELEGSGTLELFRAFEDPLEAEDADLIDRPFCLVVVDVLTGKVFGGETVGGVKIAAEEDEETLEEAEGGIFLKYSAMEKVGLVTTVWK